MKLYHISEGEGIEIFEPRPSPQAYQNIKDNVVFAVTEEMLHNYLLPRDSPRVTYYSKPDSTNEDIEKFIGNNGHKYIINVEEGWLERIKQTTLYLYELPHESFILLDEGSGYYISYSPVKPVKVKIVNDILSELACRDVELRSIQSLKALAYEVSKSSLQFSIIRIRNAV
jgi:hypothetical protein